jgi:2-hydroxychromene-2-carboxylate isomerase
MCGFQKAQRLAYKPARYKDSPNMITVDYYLAPQSPWAYLGHQRLTHIVAAAGAQIRVLPVDFGQVFAASGGLPLAQRPAQRRAYRLMELQRFSQHLGLPLNLHPLHFPVGADDAARLIIAVNRADGSAAALDLTGRVLRAVWVEERNIASLDDLAALLTEAALPAARLAERLDPAVQTQYQESTDAAITAGVFGAPSVVIAGEIFWGQDRLDFVQRRLAQAA